MRSTNPHMRWLPCLAMLSWCASIPCAADEQYSVLISETRDGQTRNPNFRTDNNKPDLGLYTGHTPREPAASPAPSTP